MKRRFYIVFLLSVTQAVTMTLALGCGAHCQTVRIKDIANIEGDRTNQLVGYGLVVGLDGSGDSQQTIFTAQSVANMLSNFGVIVPAAKMKVKNVAAVMVTADLPPFGRPGSKIDIVVSSVGDARSLQGGTLLQTPLKAATGQVYAVAQGPVSVGGFTVGGGGTSVTKNHTTVGRVPGGAIIERGVKSEVSDGAMISVLLDSADYATAARVAGAIDGKLGAGAAAAADAGTITVRIPDSYGKNVVGLIADIGELTVTRDTTAKVVVNERTGTVVVGGAVRVSPCAVSHGNLSVEISSDLAVSQPAPLSKGSTVAVPQKTVEAREQDARLVALKGGSSIEELVRALNALKVTPRDIIAILQAIKQAGALSAELEVI